MRLSILSAVLPILALQVQNGVAAGQHRKTLSFGPRLHHATFGATAWTPHPPLALTDYNPYKLAEAFTSHLHPHAQYRIRNDSYTDTLSGISHVYLQQFVDGLEVLNGRLNLNIKDRVVLSYGDSFFQHVQSEHTITATTDVHAQHCASVGHTMAQQQGLWPQRPLSPRRKSFGDYAATTALHEDNCGRRRLASSCAHGAPLDARTAALVFMVHATPRDELAETLATDFDVHLSLTILDNPSSQVHGWSHVVHNVPDTTQPVVAKLALIQTPSNGTEHSRLHRVWKLLVHMEHNAYEVAMSINSPPTIMSVIDRVSDSPQYTASQQAEERGGPHTYRVFAWGVNDPDSGSRTNVTIVPDRLASPLGWHSVPITHMPAVLSAIPDPRDSDNFNTTLGNNVLAQELWYKSRNRPWQERYRPTSSTSWPALTFDSLYEPKVQPNKLTAAQQYIDASITQIWYTMNMIHDLFYRYGFDESAGNFQQYNFGRGGKEYDAIILNVQDHHTLNNSWFQTNPDGQNPVCHVYLWGSTSGVSPYRDGAFQADMVIHEFTHGLSARLAGGPADVTCLKVDEAGGLSEGWSDFVALVLRASETDEDLVMGAWVSDNSAGIRDHPYSLNHSVNPTTYRWLDDRSYATSVHRTGEVWAAMLWGVLHRLVRMHGLCKSLFPPEVPDDTFYRLIVGEKSVPRHGNTLALRLVIDAMKLLPCEPTFIQARDAILLADEDLTDGQNGCEIWRGFADRGLGIHAHVIHGAAVDGSEDVHVEDYGIPLFCQSE